MNAFASLRRSGRGRDPQAGLTLIEVLVVIAVIGVASGATMMGIGGADRDARAESESTRLARNLSLAVDEALISGLPLMLVWDASGYTFVAWHPAEVGNNMAPALDGDWQPAGIPLLAARHNLRTPLQMQAIDGPTEPLVIAASGAGPARNFGFAGNGAAWRVAFDGFTAAAAPWAPQ